ncbi:MAG: hypothetical protein EPN26_11760 [Rhodospirillales bacterium]|nr:MAG: hypothetical protein EPN26_11760 [Rhodospirillales bacterium]
MAQDFSGAVSLLSGTASLQSSSIQDLIYQKIMDQYKGRIEKESAERKEIFDVRAKYYEGKTETLSIVRGGIDLAANYVKDSAAAAKKIKDLIFDMKVFLESASRDPTYYAQEFDKKLAELNSAANELPGAYNLVGAKSRTNYAANSFDMKLDEFGTKYTMEGANISSDYKITDSAGKIWMPEFFSNTIKRYNNFDSSALADTTTYSTAQSAAAGAGSATSVVVDRTDTNYSSSTITFNAGGTSYTGTISKGGLGVTQSWVYGGFQDAGGIAQAVSDVNAALEDAELEQTRLSSLQAYAEGQYSVISNTVEENKVEMTNALIAQMEEEYDFAAKIKTQYQAAVTSIASIAETQRQYSQVFGALLGKDKLMSYIYSQTV